MKEPDHQPRSLIAKVFMGLAIGLGCIYIALVFWVIGGTVVADFWNAIFAPVIEAFVHAVRTIFTLGGRL